ncbi:hypothetical protein Dimus_013982, partial [Dionaea muscipula]
WTTPLPGNHCHRRPALKQPLPSPVNIADRLRQAATAGAGEQRTLEPNSSRPK